MTTVGPNTRVFEDAYKKLSQQLESVYDSVKSKADFDSVETQKEEFMKLFCKAFDSNPEYDEEDGLTLVALDDSSNEIKPKNTKKHKKHKNKNKKNKNNNNNNNKELSLISSENNGVTLNDNSIEGQKDMNLSKESAPIVDDASKDIMDDEISKSRTTPDSISVNLPSESDKNLSKEEEPLTPRGLLKLEHGSFSNTKRPNPYLTENAMKNINNKETEQNNNNIKDNNENFDDHQNSTNDVNDVDKTNENLGDTGLGLNHNLCSEQSDSANTISTSEGVGRGAMTHNDEKAENSNDGLPSLSALGNASEVAQLLSGNSVLARQLAMSKGSDWHPEYSNRSWGSISSGSSEQDLMSNAYMDINTSSAQNQALFPPNANPDQKMMGLQSEISPDFDAATIQLHAVRQVLRNLILLLLAHHPNGVYDNQLQMEYQRMLKMPLQMDDNIEYLLFNHRNVLITPCVNQNNLLTLNHQAVQSILEEYSPQEISSIVSGHINTIMKLFPDGIASNILDEMVSNFRGYKLSQVVADPHQFVMEKCDVISHTDEGSSIYFPATNTELKSSPHNYSRVLSSAIGYRELLIALLANHKKPIGIEQLESEFEELFNMPLNACSPVINRILKKINDPALNQEQKQSQLEHALHVLDQANNSRGSLRSSLRSSYNSLKSMVSKFRLAANFELHYEKNRALFELFCPKVRQDTTVIKSPFKEDHRMVFMGGFAHGTSIKELEEALAKYGVKVIDCKGISYRNYGWSFVKVETPEQAEQLAACSPIQIRGRNIDVRPFIDRKRVKNHQQNRPSANELLDAVLEAVHQTPSGLTVAQIQTNLFHKFQFRVDGTEITKLVSKNAKLLQIKRHPIERIIPTPKMHRLSMEELKSKILKIWTDSDYDNSDKKKGMEGEKMKEQKVLSLADFENEFARRYKAFLEPRLYGYHSVHELLQSMNDILCFPQVHIQSSRPQPPGSLVVDPSSIARVTGTMPIVANGGNIDNTNNLDTSTMFNTNGLRAMTPGANPSSTTNRNTILSNGSTLGIDQSNTVGQAMHAPSNSLMNSTRGLSMQAFTCMPMQSSYQPMPFMSNPGIPLTMTPMQMYPGSVLPQLSDADFSNLPTLENYLSLQSIPTDQQQLFLPSMSNLGAFSNRSLGSQSPGASKQNNMKPAVGNNMPTANGNAVPVFNQLPNGSQFITPTKNMG